MNIQIIDIQHKYRHANNIIDLNNVEFNNCHRTYLKTDQYVQSFVEHIIDIILGKLKTLSKFQAFKPCKQLGLFIGFNQWQDNSLLLNSLMFSYHNFTENSLKSKVKYFYNHFYLRAIY